jgi:hypothetical protein
VRPLRLLYFHGLVLWLLLALLAGLSGHASATVCRLPGLEGFDAAAARAKRVLPAVTRDPKQAVVYVEKTAEGLYFHSNFISRGAEHPTKIGREDITDGALAFVNIVHTERPSDAEWRATEQTFRDHVRVMLDVSVFDKDGLVQLDLTGVKNITIVDGKAGRSVAANVEVLSTNTPPPLLTGRIAGCCLFGRPPHVAVDLGSQLKARPLNRDQVAFISLVRDTGTQAAIGKTSLLKARTAATGPDIKGLDEIEAALRGQSGKTVVLIGHTEGDRYVGRSADNRVVFTVPVADVRALARKHDVELIDLGCKTARLLPRVGEVGVANRFNTVEAVHAIERALGTSKNHAEFLERITSDGLKVIVDRAFVERSSIRGSIYQRVDMQSLGRSNSWWQKVADLFITAKQ